MSQPHYRVNSGNLAKTIAMPALGFLLVTVGLPMADHARHTWEVYLGLAVFLIVFLAVMFGTPFGRPSPPAPGYRTMDHLVDNDTQPRGRFTHQNPDGSWMVSSDFVAWDEGGTGL